MSKYTLKFTAKKGDSGDKTDFSVSSVQLTDKDSHLNVPNPAPSGLENITFQLTGLKYDKRNYSPCRVDAVVSVAGCPSSAGIDDIVGIFAGKTVELSSQVQLKHLQRDPVTVGSDYFVYQVKPVLQFENASADSVPCTVNLVIYSRDFLLTIDRFSRSYLSQKLSSDILASSLKCGEGGGVLGNCRVEFESDVKRLQFTSLDDKELIQPYHVQYNEDFYSFVARIAARHGEFLFFEDGRLNLGLPHDKDVISLESLTAADNSNIPLVLSMEKDTLGDSPLEVESYYSNYLYREENMFDTIYATADVIKDQNAVAGKPVKPDSKKLYFNEDAFDEYFDVFGTNSDTAPDGMIMEQSGGFWLMMILTRLAPMISSAAHDTKFSRVEILARMLAEIGLEETSMHFRVKETNDLYIDDRVKIPVRYEDEQYGGNDKDKLCQFGTYTGAKPEGDSGNGGNESPQQYNFMKTFYTSIREAELGVSRKVIKMKLRPGCVTLNVGDTVSFSGKKYVIVKVSAEYAFKPANDILSIDAIELADSGTPVCPPYDKCSEHSKAAPQTAVVTDHMDPRYLNRVRIRYPWQPESDMASPWVRTSTPFASPNGAACSFVMKAGSQVMVDYIDGNIDRPYIVGSMFTTENNPTCHSTFYSDREIRAESGARLKLGMGNLATHVKNFIPFAGAATPFISPYLGKWMVQLANWMPVMGKAAGTATLTDAFGMFTISGDTSARQVTIDSAIGKVSISALTGITISAPLGDVTIAGHNIKLRAANNISIESGLNIKDELDVIERQKRHKRLDHTDSTVDSLAKDAGDILARTVADLMLGAVDMSLFRTIYNAVSAPKEGTLRIKSHRFVNIEAGDGRAMDRAGGFAPKNLDAKQQVARVDKFAHAAEESFKKRIIAVREAYWDYMLLRNDVNVGLRKTGEEIIEKTLGVAGARFSDDELYSAIRIVSFSHIDDIDKRELVTHNLEVACDDLKKYLDNPKSTSGTFKDGLDSFTDEQVADLTVGVRLVTEHHLKTNNETDAKLVHRLCALPDDASLDSAFSNFRKAVFRYSLLKCVGTDGFCLKWSEGYNVGRITIDRNGVEPWVDPIRNIRISFDDTSYRGHYVIRENFKNPYAISTAAVDSVWNPLQKGRVLISETPGTTLGITPNHNEWEAMDNLDVEFVRRYLAQK